mmetsp:Transcript_48259/g.121460  ORF Transcript_48259/g.121460 Transcript_48259/m.121460 type:complete len:395 (+) Transcript_48259:3447-4631(+)
MGLDTLSNRVVHSLAVAELGEDTEVAEQTIVSSITAVPRGTVIAENVHANPGSDSADGNILELNVHILLLRDLASRNSIDQVHLPPLQSGVGGVQVLGEPVLGGPDEVGGGGTVILAGDSLHGQGTVLAASLNVERLQASAKLVGGDVGDPDGHVVHSRLKLVLHVGIGYGLLGPRPVGQDLGVESGNGLIPSSHLTTAGHEVDGAIGTHTGGAVEDLLAAGKAELVLVAHRVPGVDVSLGNIAELIVVTSKLTLVDEEGDRSSGSSSNLIQADGQVVIEVVHKVSLSHLKAMVVVRTREPSNLGDVVRHTQLQGGNNHVTNLQLVATPGVGGVDILEVEVRVEHRNVPCAGLQLAVRDLDDAEVGTNGGCAVDGACITEAVAEVGQMIILLTG